MTAATAVMSGGQGVRLRCDAERDGGAEDHGFACGGLLLCVLIEAHGRLPLRFWRNGFRDVIPELMVRRRPDVALNHSV
jgi:hypothetical protein